MGDLDRSARDRVLALKAATGDRSARESLIVENLDVGIAAARRVMRKFRRRFTREDLVSLCAPGMIHAADRWDPGRGDFGPYAQACVRCLAIDALLADRLIPIPKRARSADNGPAGRPVSFGLHADRVRAEADRDGGPSGEGRGHDDVRLLLPLLKGPEVTILVMRLGLDDGPPRRLREIAGALGVTTQAVDSRARSIASKLGRLRASRDFERP